MSTVVTIENLLKKCGLHENDLKLEIKRKYFPEISRCLTKWKVLSYKMLEFNEGDVTAIEADNLHEEERRFKFLELLKQRLAFKSTYELLVRNLLEIERAEDALSLCVHLKSKFCFLQKLTLPSSQIVLSSNYCTMAKRNLMAN